MADATSRSQRILITGGSGFVGTNLIRTLLAAGWADIVSLDTDVNNGSSDERVRRFVADIRDRDAVAQAIEGVDWVVHAAAVGARRQRREVTSTNAVGTRIVLEAALRRHVDRVVFLSTAAVYGVPDRLLVTEDHPLSGAGAFSAAKIRGEQLCEDSRARGACVTVLRPQPCVRNGRGNGFHRLFRRIAEGRWVPVIGSALNRWQLVDVQDLSDAILLCLTADRAVANDTFNIGAEGCGAVRDDIQALIDSADSGARIVRQPIRATLLCLSAPGTLRVSPLLRSVSEMSTGDACLSIERATERLGFRPRFSSREALLRGYKWYLKARRCCR